MLVPKGRFYAEKVTGRRSNVGGVLNVSSRNALADLLRVLIDNEVTIVKLKDELRHKLSWNNWEAWNTLNKLNVSKVVAEDFRSLLRDHRHVVTYEEVDLYLER